MKLSVHSYAIRIKDIILEVSVVTTRLQRPLCNRRGHKRLRVSFSWENLKASVEALNTMCWHWKMTCGNQNQRWRACLDTSVFTFVTLPSEESVTNTVGRPGGLGEGPGSSFRQEKIQFGKLNYSRWSQRPPGPRGRGERNAPPNTASDSAHSFTPPMCNASSLASSRHFLDTSVWRKWLMFFFSVRRALGPQSFDHTLDVFFRNLEKKKKKTPSEGFSGPGGGLESQQEVLLYWGRTWRVMWPVRITQDLTAVVEEADVWWNCNHLCHPPPPLPPPANDDDDDPLSQSSWARAPLNTSCLCWWTECTQALCWEDTCLQSHLEHQANAPKWCIYRSSGSSGLTQEHHLEEERDDADGHRSNLLVFYHSCLQSCDSGQSHDGRNPLIHLEGFIPLKATNISDIF